MVTQPQPMTGLPMRRPRSTLDPTLVLAAVADAAAQVSPGVTLTVSDTLEVVATEGGRSIAAHLADLVDRFEARRVPNDPARLAAALLGWADERPVPDEVAYDKGVAVLGWGGPLHPIWQVAVPRTSGMSAHWVPSLRTPHTHTAQVRDRALERSRSMTITPTRSGAVTVWTFIPNPHLSSAVLAQSTVLAAEQPIGTLCAVITPGRPVVIAEVSAAQRLAADVNEPHVIVTLDSLTNIGWK